jgi:hypothetical protein
MKAALQAPETGPQTRSNTPLHEAENEEGESFTTADSEYTEEEEEEDGVSGGIARAKDQSFTEPQGKNATEQAIIYAYQPCCQYPGDTPPHPTSTTNNKNHAIRHANKHAACHAHHDLCHGRE